MKTNQKKYTMIDLFAGCGGLTEGFESSGHYKTIACVEWDKYAAKNLEKRLKDKWHYRNSPEMVLRFDIQRTQELFDGWHDDKEFGTCNGLDFLIKKMGTVDLIVGGPPCQAYSIAGRVQDKNGMKYDYRNYLFESYLKVVGRYKPRFAVFENVQGILSAAPDGELITKKIQSGFNALGYYIINDLRQALFDLSDFGVPQVRKRVIIFAVRADSQSAADKILNKFYFDLMQKQKVSKKRTVSDAIRDLPAIYPTGDPHKPYTSVNNIKNHIARFQSQRDMDVFYILAKDIEQKEFKYTSSVALKQLYEKVTHKTSNIHKYNVLRWNLPSNTIPAHLCKDGLRHIHPDSTQSRSITVREAARLQTFPDDFEFIGPQTQQFKIIGNAVPPVFANILANIIYKLFDDES